MKINKEDFDKLSQLDRIEFRQRRNEIDEKYSVGISTILYSLYLIVFYLFAVIIVNIYLTVIESSNSISPIIWILIILPLSYFIDIWSAGMNNKKTKELIQEYFKVEVKKKK